VLLNAVLINTRREVKDFVKRKEKVQDAQERRHRVIISLGSPLRLAVIMDPSLSDEQSKSKAL
jgi:hypothetical protein